MNKTALNYVKADWLCTQDILSAEAPQQQTKTRPLPAAQGTSGYHGLRQSRMQGV